MPFNDDFKTTPIHLSQLAPAPARDKPHPHLPKKESLVVGAVGEGGESQEGLAKLRFYNSLRAEVKKLTEDTEKIINAEMDKLSQM